MASAKQKLSSSSQPLSLTMQDRHIRQQFPRFSCLINGACATWRGNLQPRPLSTVYQIEVLYRKKLLPKVKVLKPALAKDPPHVYPDRSLCLYWPDEWRWQQNIVIADTIIPWAASWLYYYELWLDTGKWLGPSSHD